MKNKYTISFVYEIISKSEFKLEEYIVHFGEESWPITRNMLWLFLINFKKKNIVEEKKIKFIFKNFDLYFKKSKRILINCWRNFIYKISKKDFLKKSKFLFFSRSVYLEKVGSEMLFDRIIDPLYMTSIFNNQSIKIYVDNPILKNNLIFKGLNYFPNKFYFLSELDSNEYKKLEKSGIFLLKLFVELNDLYEIEELLIKELKISIQKYLISKKKSYKFLKKFTSIKKIFLPAWYFPDMMGIIASAKQLGISTIEVQHGKQGKLQAAYSGWNYFPENGFLNMPDTFWSWGKKSIHNILRSSPDRKFHKPVLGGYAWPIWYKTFIQNESNLDQIKKSKVKLLFTMQGNIGDTNDEQLPNSLLNLVKYYEQKSNKTSEKIFELKIRIHPSKVNEDYFYLKKRLGELFYSELISYSSKLNCSFYDDLLWANHHITFYSSCALEALIFGVKSAVYGNEGYKIYEEEIKDKSITYLQDNTLEEILLWIDKGTYPAKKSYKDNFEIVLPNPDLIYSI